MQLSHRFDWPSSSHARLCYRCVGQGSCNAKNGVSANGYGLQAVGSTGPASMILYVIESDSGLLITSLDKYGDLLPYWNSRQVAEEMCKLYEAPLPQRVSEMSLLEFYGQLLALRKGGMGYVLMDKQPDRSARIVPIDEGISLYGKLLSDSTTYRHSSMDESVRLIDGLRRVGVPVETKDEYLPIDCPICDSFISVHEIAYRSWRDGTTAEMLCPHCLSTFSEAIFVRAACVGCGAASGFMPPSLRRTYSEGDRGWRCQACHNKEGQEELLQRINQIREPAKPPASGCLVFVLLGVGIISGITWIA
jgi:hypothetical protein